MISQSSKIDKTKQYIIYAQIYVISKTYSLKSKENINTKFKILFTSWGRQGMNDKVLINICKW